MRTISTRELQHNTRKIRELVEAGESFEWKNRGETVGYLTPAEARSPTKPWPDLRARLKTLSSGQVDEHPTASEIIYSDRDRDA